MPLKPEDFKTAAWRRVRQHAEERLQALRERNDQAAHNEIQTALIRGQIKAFKEILALEQSASPVDERGDSPIETPGHWQT